MSTVPRSRKTFLQAALVGSLLLALAGSVQAQTKIATVDLKKIFEGYYKTKQADAQLRERGSDADKQYKALLEDYQKASEEYKKLIDDANNQAVSAEEREKRKKTAE